MDADARVPRPLCFEAALTLRLLQGQETLPTRRADGSDPVAVSRRSGWSWDPEQRCMQFTNVHYLLYLCISDRQSEAVTSRQS